MNAVNAIATYYLCAPPNTPLVIRYIPTFVIGTFMGMLGLDGLEGRNGELQMLLRVSAAGVGVDSYCKGAIRPDFDTGGHVFAALTGEFVGFITGMSTGSRNIMRL